jgi:hypothetical protein
MDHTPQSWTVSQMGYKHRVRTGYTHKVAMYKWLYTQLGDEAEGVWLDQGAYICFVHELDAVMFDMVWS